MGKVKQYYTTEAEKKLDNLADMLKQKLITPEYVRKQIKGDQAIQMFVFNCDEDEMNEHITEFIKYVQTSVRLVVDNQKKGLVDE
tara:strand:+ start:43 stop:297 length:255 start_codon:yes stop_codon:yes gene_type:complete